MTASPSLPRPRLIVLDVNETLSDMAPLAGRFADVGAPTHLAQAWFAELLRDGFALTAAGASAPFATIGQELLRARLAGADVGPDLDRDVDDAVAHVMAGFSELTVHPDVAPGLRVLADLDVRLVTLSNGSASVAETLLERAGVLPLLERLLSVEQAGAWKPAAASYAYALAECGVDAADAMLVAVHPWDVDGAARAGLRTAWVDRVGVRYPAHLTAPDLTVASLPELARALA